MHPIVEKVEVLVRPIVEDEGYELYDVAWVKDLGRTVLRICISKEGGISVEDCARINHLLGDLIEVKCDITQRYDLEVSSPGLNRSLKTKKHFDDVLGKIIKFKTKRQIDGRQNYKGVLKSVSEEELTVIIDNRDYPIPLNEISQANLEYFG